LNRKGRNAKICEHLPEKEKGGPTPYGRRRKKKKEPPAPITWEKGSPDRKRGKKGRKPIPNLFFPARRRKKKGKRGNNRPEEGEKKKGSQARRLMILVLSFLKRGRKKDK